MAETILTLPLPGSRTLALVHGNLVHERVDAIVNAANEHLQHGGGVAGAIVRAGGSVIQDESDRIGHVPTGSAAITGAGSLPARHVIHAVGPVWHGGSGREPELLAAAVAAALGLASERGLATVALPAISTGIYGYPKQAGATVIVGAIARFVHDHPATSVRDIRITLLDRESVDVFREVMSPAAGG